VARAPAYASSKRLINFSKKCIKNCFSREIHESKKQCLEIIFFFNQAPFFKTSG